MIRRLFLSALAALLCSGPFFALPATAAPAGPIVQTNTGASAGPTFAASLKKLPKAGNSIVIVAGLDSASTVGVLEPDDVANVVDASETYAAWQVPGAPYAIAFAAKADPTVRTWGFHGVSQPHTWLAVEVSGLSTYQPSGVPIWDGPAASSIYAVGTGTTSLATGHRSATAVPHELVLSTFVNRVTAGTPPTVSAFSNTIPQPGTWVRLGASVATSGGANHRLDVAFKEVASSTFYDGTADWPTAPAGMSSMLTGFYMP